MFVTQLTYQNFGRYYYNIRQCAAADLGSMTWLAMHCDSELDWICKIPRGIKQRIVCSPLGMQHHSSIAFSIFYSFLYIPHIHSLLYGGFVGTVEKQPESSEGQSYLRNFERLSTD